MVYYKLVKVTINTLGLAEVIMNVIVWHPDLPNSILSDKSSLFTSKLWSSLGYFPDIKRQLSTALHPQSNK